MDQGRTITLSLGKLPLAGAELVHMEAEQNCNTSPE